jgi:NADH-quinone oxidoreductase subunit F
MTFEEIQVKAMDEWEALKGSDKPVIYVGAATCGRSAGALQVIDALKEGVSERGIDAKIIQVGCLGLCYAEPMIYIAKSGRPLICYDKITPELAKELINDYLVNDDPRPDLAMGIMGGGEVDGISNLWEHPMLKPQIRIVLRNCGRIDPENINHYIANGGFDAINKLLYMEP